MEGTQNKRRSWPTITTACRKLRNVRAMGGKHRFAGMRVNLIGKCCLFGMKNGLRFESFPHSQQ